eukprot:scaffold11693_cov115-Isochrysis_galbana.AAC.5
MAKSSWPKRTGSEVALQQRHVSRNTATLRGGAAGVAIMSLAGLGLASLTPKRRADTGVSRR